MTAIKEKNILPALQVARAIAATMVVVDHTMLNMSRINIIPESFAFSLGSIGVFLFFAISGFIMYKTNTNKFSSVSNGGDFFIRRIIRILPLYTIATVLQFINKHSDTSLYNIPNLVKSLLFIPYVGDSDLFRPVLGQGWTLNFEMMFYVVFALSLCMPKKIGISLVTIILFSIAIASMIFHPSFEIVKFYLSTIVAYFAIGILVALFHSTKISNKLCFNNGYLSVFSCVVLLIGAVVLNIISSGLIKLIILLIMIALALFVVSGEKSKFTHTKIANIGKFLGDASFSIYLFHGFVIGLASHFIKPSFPLFVNIAVAISGIIGAIVFGSIVHVFIEKPIQNILLNLYKRIAN